MAGTARSVSLHVSGDWNRVLIDSPVSLAFLMWQSGVSHGEERQLFVQRLLTQWGSISLCDIGCGEATLLRKLLDRHQQETSPPLESLVGVDHTLRSLRKGAKLLRRAHDDAAVRSASSCGRPPPKASLVCGSFAAITPFACDVITLIEVIEHLDPPDLDLVGEVLLGRYAP